jgi:hypothetical protein
LATGLNLYFLSEVIGADARIVGYKTSESLSTKLAHGGAVAGKDLLSAVKHGLLDAKGLTNGG